MSISASPSTGKVYGVERVCSAWGVPRSSFYHEHISKSRADEERPMGKTKRGPKPKITDDELLAIDGAKVFTLDDGWGWVFACVEHWNAECMGWQVCKKGNRFAAMEPVSMALEREFRSTERGIARGLSLRIDNGNQYTSGRFTTQIKSWGFAPSYAFVSQPETNGVVERFFRTLKEQAIYGRAFRNLEEVRQAVAVWC